MTQFVPGSPDDHAWCKFYCAALPLEVGLGHTNVDASIDADAMMAERAKRLMPQEPEKPAWRCETCRYNEPEKRGHDDPVWCSKHQWGHDLPDWGCSDWEQKQEPPAP